MPSDALTIACSPANGNRSAYGPLGAYDLMSWTVKT